MYPVSKTSIKKSNKEEQLVSMLKMYVQSQGHLICSALYDIYINNTYVIEGRVDKMPL